MKSSPNVKSKELLYERYYAYFIHAVVNGLLNATNPSKDKLLINIFLKPVESVVSKQYFQLALFSLVKLRLNTRLFARLQVTFVSKIKYMQ